MIPTSFRRGFTILECVIAMALMSTAAVVLSQLAVRSLIERSANDARLAAIEWAANVLEAAQARDWADLTPDWAAKQHLPEDLTVQLNDAVTLVQVEPESDRPQVKRVTVTVQWKRSDNIPGRPVALTGLFAARERRATP